MKVRKEILVDSGRMYALTQDSDGNYYLEVLVGGFAMYEVVLPLTPEEVAAYEKNGKYELDTLAFKVAKDKSRFADRLIK
jgi:hypothetical protein